MAYIKVPDGGFYVDDSQVTVDYANNTISITGGGEGGNFLPLSGGTMDADAQINGTEELIIGVADAGNTASAAVGINPEGVTLVHNTNSDADARVRVVQGSVEISAGDSATVQVNGTGVNFGGLALSNIATIGASSADIAFENDMDMNNHTITNLADPVSSSDAMTKNYADITYQPIGEMADYVQLTDLATTSTAGLVNKGAAVANATNADDIVAQFNALLTSLRNANIIES